jgi:hypothetical protein
VSFQTTPYGDAAHQHSPGSFRIVIGHVGMCSRAQHGAAPRGIAPQ